MIQQQRSVTADAAVAGVEEPGAVLDAGPASTEFVAPDGAWDWDAAWAASRRP